VNILQLYAAASTPSSDAIAAVKQNCDAFHRKQTQ